jgi:plastocyanin
VLVAGSGLPGAPAPGTAAAASSTVTMTENVFWSSASSSSVVTIRAGESVTWLNNGDDLHNADAEDGSWRSGNLRPGQSYSRRFDLPGEYRYVCSLHLAEEMIGKVVVLPADGPATPGPARSRVLIPYTAR